MLTIIFYTTNGAAAKLRSREIAAVKQNYARVYDAGIWDNSNDPCDAVEIMPDVPQWQIDRIVKVYGNKVVDVKKKVFDEALPVDSVTGPDRKLMGLMPVKEQPVAVEKKAVHKGGGRWFVMLGEERLSGPHDKAEAQRLIAA